MKCDRLMVFSRFTTDLAQLSKCEDKKTAAILVDTDLKQVLSIGINGGISGGVQCLCTNPKYTCIHAEANALLKCISTEKRKVMLCVLSPCVTCAAMIINAGVVAVYFQTRYKNIEGLRLLHDASVEVYELKARGYTRLTQKNFS